MEQNFKIITRTQLLKAAQDYFKLLDKVIVLKSKEFKYKKQYTLKFIKGNFLHLTGVYSFLKPADFFEKCFDGTITIDDFKFTKTHHKNIIKIKMRNLVNLSAMFNEEIFVQENFIKNRVTCGIATSDNKKTLGFIETKHYFLPKTLLDKNHLDPGKPIIKIKPIKTNMK